ncbi:MAG TPA: hypothetical protein DD490_09245, partial [Acidobacteria bacterium]|nr:hypothetical protein [Acidobacteriota bacterium]
MSFSTFANQLIPWVLQITLLLAAGLALPALVRLREPRTCLFYGQGVLLAVLLVPVLPLLIPRLGSAAFDGVAVFSVSSRWLAPLASLGKGTSGDWSPERVVPGVLVLGAAVRLAWLGLGLVSLRVWRRNAVPAVLAPETAALAQRLAARASLLVSPRVGSPVTFGWRRPVVLLPAGFAALPPEAQRGIVCHELLHVRRHDWLFALGEEVARALLWFHPAAWMLLARIALSREQVVDREAVRLTGSRRA